MGSEAGQARASKPWSLITRHLGEARVGHDPLRHAGSPRFARSQPSQPSPSFSRAQRCPRACVMSQGHGRGGASANERAGMRGGMIAGSPDLVFRGTSCLQSIACCSVASTYNPVFLVRYLRISPQARADDKDRSKKSIESRSRDIISVLRAESNYGHVSCNMYEFSRIQ
jgi:hypothetical protein